MGRNFLLPTEPWTVVGKIVARGIFRAARGGLGEGPEKDKGGHQEGPKKGQRMPKESPGEV